MASDSKVRTSIEKMAETRGHRARPDLRTGSVVGDRLDATDCMLDGDPCVVFACSRRAPRDTRWTKR